MRFCFVLNYARIIPSSPFLLFYNTPAPIYKDVIGPLAVDTRWSVAIADSRAQTELLNERLSWSTPQNIDAPSTFAIPLDDSVRVRHVNYKRRTHTPVVTGYL